MQHSQGPVQTGKNHLASFEKPAFVRRRRLAAVYSLAAGTGLALLISSAFYVYGEFSKELANPKALHLGLFAGTFNLALFILVQARRLLGRSRDGLVIDKAARVYGPDTLYTVLVQGPGTRKRRISFLNDRERYAYYKLGDQVRYHAGWNFLEKKDKSGDLFVFCLNCARKYYLADQACPRCGWPL